MGTTHRNQFIQLQEWTTWNNQPASAWIWQPTFELRKEMPWLPVSIGFKTLDEAEQAVDHFLDNVDTLREKHEILVNAPIS
jgi:hypothetical protein